ncbi:hypothetical protein L6Q82_30415, partial [Burkholderia cenocepacia]|nr:hypothetical protein [Burkholderia cenocepacia]
MSGFRSCGVRQRFGDRIFGRHVEGGNRRADNVFPRREIDGRVERRRGCDLECRRGGRIVDVTDLVVGVMRNHAIVGAGFRQRVRCSVIERRATQLASRRLRDARFCRHEGVEHDRRAIVVRGHGIVFFVCCRNVGVLGCNVMCRGGECVRRDRRCRRYRRGHAACCHGGGRGCRVRCIGRLCAAQRRPLRGAGLDRTQRVVNARRRRNRRGRLLV